MEQLEMEILEVLISQGGEVEMLDESSNICEKSMKLLIEKGLITSKYIRDESGFTFMFPKLTFKGREAYKQANLYWFNKPLKWEYFDRFMKTSKWLFWALGALIAWYVIK